MNYYKITDGKLEITNSSVELKSPWIEFIYGEEPKELEDALVKQKKEDDVILGIVEAKDYLASTDWYYARSIETGEEIPEDVVIKRTEAREFIRSQEDA